MKVKLNVSTNEMYSLITALRVQRQELTERMLFQSDDLDLNIVELNMMFVQTDNVYQQLLPYLSESFRKQLDLRDNEYMNELKAFEHTHTHTHKEN